MQSDFHASREHDIDPNDPTTWPRPQNRGPAPENRPPPQAEDQDDHDDDELAEVAEIQPATVAGNGADRGPDPVSFPAVDRTELARFVRALFANLDPFGFVSLRAFRQFPPKDGERDRPLHIEAVRLNLGLEPVIDAAVRIALRVSNGGEPGVFAPPVCTFIGRTGAKASDVHEAPVLSVEIDQGNLEQIIDRLSLILGDRPAIVLHSGSTWTDPETGELLPKGHLHWKLRQPARGPEQQKMLRRARDIATLIAGADPSAIPPVHPLRWPGSWNRKSEPPVMAKIIEENATVTLNLADALAALEDAAQAADLATPTGAPYLAADDLPAELAEIAEWLRVYTTADLRAPGHGLWHDWNKVAMAIHRATGGSDAGYQLFRAWSETSHFYNEAGCRARWDAITGCPATWIGARFLRRMASERGWWSEPSPSPPPPDEPAPSSEAGDDQLPPDEDAEAGDGQGDTSPEPYGPPTEAEFIADLAGIDEIAFARIVKAKAASLNVDVPTLTRRVQRARSEAKARAKTEEREARAKAKAEAKAKAQTKPPLTAAEIEVEIERLAKLSAAAFYIERPAAALRLRCSPTELTELVRRAKADYARKNATIPPFVTEQDVMRAFVTCYSDDLRFNHSSGNWLVWAEHFWQPDQRKLAFYWSLDLCKRMAPTCSDEGRAVVEKVRFSDAVEKGARTMPAVATEQSDWDNDPWLLGTPGGVVDLKTGTLRPGDRSDMITKTTAATPAVIPDCPEWDGFLNFAMNGDDQLVRFMQRYFGYCLTGLTIEEIFLFLFGPGGAGKGTLIETVAHIMGDYAGTAPMEVFTGLSWAPTEYYRADMVGKRLIVANEPERGAYWAEAFIKESTGGDTLSGRHPAGRPFRFKPTHKMALSGNHMPRLRGRSTGMERRLRILPFTRKPENPNTGLKSKLLAEAPAILRWMIEGCLAWQKIGLQPSDAIKAANDRYFEMQDVFRRWVDDCCILDKTLQLDPSTLRTSFNNWAKANGEDEMNGNAFSEAIDQFDCSPPLTRGRTKGKRWVKGIGLTPPISGRYSAAAC